jgi:hypothetical protein
MSHNPLGINGVAFSDVILHAKFAITVLPVDNTEVSGTVGDVVGLIDICE